MVQAGIEVKGLLKKVDADKLGVLQTGMVGKSNRKADDPPEQLNAYEKMEKQVYVNLLLMWLTPNKLGPKSTEAEDKRSMTNKIERQDLSFLRRFFEEDVPIEVISATQAKYKDLSP